VDSKILIHAWQLKKFSTTAALLGIRWTSLRLIRCQPYMLLQEVLSKVSKALLAITFYFFAFGILGAVWILAATLHTRLWLVSRES